jgi:lysophospholipase L1-like esterase
MSDITRREFLKALGAISAVVIAGRGAGSLMPRALGEFRILVVGDSLVWGQGLAEKDKFYRLTAEWLEREIFRSGRKVDVKVKAHSGATLKFHEDEAEKYRRAGRDEAYFYPPEVNINFPSAWKQIEVAADEYKAAGKPGGADLILLSGGITDITVSKVLDPNGDNSKLPALIEKYCGADMSDILGHAAAHNPNATIAVVGYFPMLSPKTPASKLLNSWLESMSFPRVLKPLANNALMRPLFFNRLRKKGIARSRIWFDHSNKHMAAAVDKLNTKFGETRAVFIKSPVTEDTCFETPNSLLFKMGKKGRVEDPLYSTRTAECRKTLREIKKTARIEYSERLCEIAAVGHPNPAGARAYAEAVKASLATLFSRAKP